MTETVEQRIDRETAAAMRIHNLKAAAKCMSRVKSDLKSTLFLIEDEKLADRITRVLVNDIDSIAWKIETAIREGAK